MKRAGWVHVKPDNHMISIPVVTCHGGIKAWGCQIFPFFKRGQKSRLFMASFLILKYWQL